MPSKKQTQVKKKHDAWLDALIATFTSQLQTISRKAIAAVIASLQKKLTFADDGTIASTPANQRTLRSLDTQISDAMDVAGYSALLKNVVGKFPEQQQFLQAQLQHLADETGEPSIANVNYTQAESSLFSSVQLSVVAALESVMESAARSAMQTSLAAGAGLKMSDLIETITTKVDASIARQATNADTAAITFYRNMSDSAFTKLEQKLGIDFKYVYNNPVDEKTRDFCLDLMEADKSYERDEIDAMDNGSDLSDVWISCGGFNCRGQWDIDIESANERLAQQDEEQQAA